MASITAGIRRPRRTSLRLLVMFFSSVLLLGGFQAAAQAAPATPAEVPDINYDFSQNGSQVLLKFENAEVAVNDGDLVVKDLGGNEALRYALHYDLADHRYPISATVDGGTATLTPVTDKSQARALTPKEILDNTARVDAYRTKRERDDAALARFNQELAAATAIGSLVGTVIGAVVIGGILGCAIGALGAGIGCLPGIVTGAGIGGIVGTIAAGGGGLIVAGIQYLQVINTPFRPTS